MDTDETPVDPILNPVAPEAELTTPPPDPEPEPQPLKMKAGVNFSIDGGSVSAL